jgi:RNA-directed DNA polymerase
MMPSKPSSKVSRDQHNYVLDADIAGCFDNINHDALVQKLSTYPRLAQAVKAWLRAGALDGNVFLETTSGTPQGGVFTPPTMLQKKYSHSCTK